MAKLNKKLYIQYRGIYGETIIESIELYTTLEEMPLDKAREIQVGGIKAYYPLGDINDIFATNKRVKIGNDIYAALITPSKEKISVDKLLTKYNISDVSKYNRYYLYWNLNTMNGWYGELDPKDFSRITQSSLGNKIINLEGDTNNFYRFNKVLYNNGNYISDPFLLIQDYNMPYYNYLDLNLFNDSTKPANMWFLFRIKDFSYNPRSDTKNIFRILTDYDGKYNKIGTYDNFQTNVVPHNINSNSNIKFNSNLNVDAINEIILSTYGTSIYRCPDENNFNELFYSLNQYSYDINSITEDKFTETDITSPYNIILNSRMEYVLNGNYCKTSITIDLFVPDENTVIRYNDDIKDVFLNWATYNILGIDSEKHGSFIKINILKDEIINDTNMHFSYQNGFGLTYNMEDNISESYIDFMKPFNLSYYKDMENVSHIIDISNYIETYKDNFKDSVPAVLVIKIQNGKSAVMHAGIIIDLHDFYNGKVLPRDFYLYGSLPSHTYKASKDDSIHQRYKTSNGYKIGVFNFNIFYKLGESIPTNPTDYIDKEVNKIHINIDLPYNFKITKQDLMDTQEILFNLVNSRRPKPVDLMVKARPLNRVVRLNNFIDWDGKKTNYSFYKPNINTRILYSIDPEVEEHDVD